MTDKPKALPSALDESLKKVEEARRMMKAGADSGLFREIAQHRKRMFDEYVKAGFTQAQALELIKGA